MFKCVINSVYSFGHEIELPFMPCIGMKIAYSDEYDRFVLLIEEVLFETDTATFYIDGKRL